MSSVITLEDTSVEIEVQMTANILESDLLVGDRLQHPNRNEIHDCHQERDDICPNRKLESVRPRKMLPRPQYLGVPNLDSYDTQYKCGQAHGNVP